ncbi:MAG: sigma 54-interacting transcriptional regulator [Desulfovibrionaceae bacterium]|nr:sigma 54-interacting transcriptional regulator [Desulfovibrionaceae bacterium]
MKRNIEPKDIEAFFESVGVNRAILEPLHSGIAIFNSQARLVFANATYKKMYRLDDSCIGLDATEFFLTAGQGIMELLKTGEANSCASVTVNGLYGVTYRWPLRDGQGRVAGCMTENISVSPQKDRISEVQQIIDELEDYSGWTSTFRPRQSTELVTFDSIVGESASMRVLKEMGRHFARHDEPVLILGENGTGKDLVAQAIHAGSARRDKNFVTVNCAAIPAELMESELFGYEAGAFTGARSQGRQGQFELAEGGTIFLDEIGEMPMALQAKLLRVLENHEIKKLGSPAPSRVDFRLISATNRDLEQMVRQGRFREDLYYRLNLFDLVVPPLRERLADIPLLAYSIMRGLLGPERSASLRIGREVLSIFSVHPWRGNVRELRNVLTYALYSMREGERELAPRHLPERFFSRADREFLAGSAEPGRPAERRAARDVSGTLSGARAESERRIIAEALAKCGGNKVKTARMLGIARSCLYKKIAALGLDGEERG